MSLALQEKYPAPPLTVHLTFEVVWLTPDIARQWLGNQARNRHFKWHKIRQYARDILADHWGLTGEPIIFGSPGKMIDGQNRCKAVIDADKGIWTVVVYGIDPEEFKRINAGAARTMADTLGIDGEKSASALAAAERLLYLWDYGLLTKPMEIMPTRDELYKVAERHPTLRDSLYTTGWCTKILTPSVTVFFHYLFSRIDGEKANYFMGKLGAGDGLADTSPIFVLRERLIQERLDGNRLAAIELYALIIRAWNAFYEKRKLTKVTWGNKERFPRVAGLEDE